MPRNLEWLILSTRSGKTSTDPKAHLRPAIGELFPRTLVRQFTASRQTAVGGPFPKRRRLYFVDLSKIRIWIQHEASSFCLKNYFFYDTPQENGFSGAGLRQN